MPLFSLPLTAMPGYTKPVAGHAGPRFHVTMSKYAIISLQGKQYRVEEGQRLFVDHFNHPADKPFHPHVLLIGGEGEPAFAPKGTAVTAKVVQDVLGDKLLVGKYRPKTGYRRHTGHRSKLTEIEITAIGGRAEKKTAEKPDAEEEPKAEAEARPKAEAKPKTAAKKAPAKKAPAKAQKEDA
jgi:large subunit ribosomal protein L21